MRTKYNRNDPVVFASSLCTRKRSAVDGGAHQGEVTALLLKLGFARVLAFEPGPKFDELHARFKHDSVVTLKAALGAVHDRMVWFGGEPGSTPKLWYADADRAGTTHMVRFDDCYPHEDTIDLVKLDIEGGELNALRGMSTTLAVNRPIVVCETADWLPQLSDGPSRRQLFDYMADFGYDIAGTFIGETVWKPR